MKLASTLFKRFSIFALLLCALASSHVAQAKDSVAQVAARKAIVAAYVNTNAAMMRKDMSRATSFVASDFVYHSMKGATLDRAGYIQSIVRLASLPQVRYTLARTENIKIVWRGPDAVVYSTQLTQLNGPGGVAYARTQFRDYWGKTSAGWQVRQAVELSGTMTVNGRVYSR